MKMKKTISLITATSLLIGACGKTEKTIVRETAPAPYQRPDESSKPSDPQMQFTDLQALWGSPYTNPAIYDLIMIDFKNNHASDVKRWNVSLNPEQLASLKADIKQNRTENSIKILVGESRVAPHDSFMAQTAANSLDKMNAEGAFDSRIEVQLAVLGQSDALRRIFDILNRQLERDNKAVTREMVADLEKHNPEAVKQIDELITKDVKARAGEIAEILKKNDRILAKYDFQDDGTKLIIYGLAAGVLANYLKDTGTVKTILKNVEEVQKLADKVNSVRLSIAALNEYRNELKKNWEDVSSSFKALKEDIAYYKDHGGFDAKNLDVSDRTKAELSRAVGDVMNGKINDEGPKDKQGLFTQEHPLSKNAENFLKSAATAADTLDKTIATVQVIADKLGVKLSPELQNAMNTAAQISQGIQLGSTVIQAYASSGLVGALGAFAGGPATMAVGAAMAMQAQAQNEAYFKKILAELSVIKQMQQETMQLQKETMQMIRDLAVMVDEYHKEDLYRMNQIYHQVLANTELSSMILNKDLRSCHAVLSFMLSDRDTAFKAEKLMVSVNNVDFLKQDIYSRINSLSSIESLLKGSAMSNPENCRMALSNAFSLDADPQSPMFARYYVQNGKSQAEVELTLYKDSLRWFTANAPKNASVEDMALHLPVASLDGVWNKEYYVRTAKEQSTPVNADALSNLISPEALEAYVTSLLTLHTLISVDDSHWTQPDQLKLDVWGDYRYPATATKRSKIWLGNALRRVNLAIAQDALLAGEPMLGRLAGSWAQIVKSVSTCTNLNPQQNMNDFCFVRQNPVMIRNLVTYMIRQHLKDRLDNHTLQDASEQEYQELLSRLLVVAQERIFDVGGEKYLALDNTAAHIFKVKLPKLEEVKKGYITYSGNMKSLLKMQRMLSDELAQMSIGGDRSNELTRFYLMK